MFKLSPKALPLSIKLFIKSYIHRGQNHHCAICNNNIKEFRYIGRNSPVNKEKKIIGAGVRKAGCPVCGSRDRDRLLFDYLVNEFRLFEKPKNLKILHIAPELLISKAIRKNGFKNYICGDLFTEGYKYPKYVQEMNVLNIPYDKDYFDLVLCNHVLEHVPDDDQAFSEIYRVLKPNAQAIIQVPISETLQTTFEDESLNTPDLREKYFGQRDHVRIYGQDFWEKLNKAGFNVEKKFCLKDSINKGINSKEPITIAHK